MTLPHERVMAVINTRTFLFNLLDPKKTPRVPSYIRKYARDCLKHYPDTAGLVDVFKQTKRKK